MTEAILAGVSLSKHFLVKDRLGKRCKLTAVDHVSFSVRQGETFALVGESGSGKTTLGLLITALLRPDSGSVLWEGQDIFCLSRPALLRFRRAVQIVFQDPFSSLDPRMRVGHIVAEGLKIHKMGKGSERMRRVKELLELVGLEAESFEKFPNQFSGGQRQRIAIARALAVEPRVLLADEPVSALDVSVQAKVLNLLARLKARKGLTLIIIAHDLRIVACIADTVAVMHLGKILELAPAAQIFAGPLHPYTKLLLDSIPAFGRRPRAPEGPAEAEPGGKQKGCLFANRCPEAMPVCETSQPQPKPIGQGHLVACHLY